MKYLVGLFVGLGLMTYAQAFAQGFADETAIFDLNEDNGFRLPFKECQKAHAATRKIVFPHYREPSRHYILVDDVIYDMRLDGGGSGPVPTSIITLECYKYDLRKRSP